MREEFRGVLIIGSVMNVYFSGFGILCLQNKISIYCGDPHK